MKNKNVSLMATVIAIWLLGSLMILILQDTRFDERLLTALRFSLFYPLIIGGTYLYFLPTIILWSRGDRRTFLVSVLNFGIAWTIFGWLVLLGSVFAMEPHSPRRS